MLFKENNKAIYLQIADRVCDDVLAGTLQPGQRIPSVREYAATLEVNANTVMRSYDHLDKLGVIFNRRGIGFFIADGAREAVMEMRRATLLGEEADLFFHQLSLLGVTSSELSRKYQKYLENQKK